MHQRLHSLPPSSGGHTCIVAICMLASNVVHCCCPCSRLLLPYTGPRDDDVDAWGLGALPMVGIELGPEQGAGWDSDGSGCGGGGGGELRGLEAFACGALGRRAGASAAARRGGSKAPSMGSSSS